MRDGKFVCALSVDTELWKSDEFFETREEAIKAGAEGLIEKAPDIFGEEIEGDQTTFAVGQVESVGIDLENAIENMFERLGEDVYDKCGEVGDDYLMYVDKGIKNKLVSLLETFFKENDLMPTCYSIESIAEHNIFSSDVEEAE